LPSLTESLDDVLGTQRVVADQQGVYFKVKPFTSQNEASYGETRLRKPEMAKGGSTGPVRKVSWDTVEQSRRSAKTPAVHRARERLARLTRGEDPSGVQ
jgi:hypothetical protein